MKWLIEVYNKHTRQWFTGYQNIGWTEWKSNAEIFPTQDRARDVLRSLKHWEKLPVGMRGRVVKKEGV